MAEIQPFRGLRFTEKAGDIGALTCPPYDIISEEQRQAYLQGNPCNVIRLELPREGEDAAPAKRKPPRRSPSPGKPPPCRRRPVRTPAGRSRSHNSSPEAPGKTGRFFGGPLSARLPVWYHKPERRRRECRFLNSASLPAPPGLSLTGLRRQKRIPPPGTGPWPPGPPSWPSSPGISFWRGIFCDRTAEKPRRFALAFLLPGRYPTAPPASRAGVSTSSFQV